MNSFLLFQQCGGKWGHNGCIWSAFATKVLKTHKLWIPNKNPHVSFPSQCFKHYSLLCLRHLFDPKWFYWKYRNSFELICHTCSALPPLWVKMCICIICICVLICCICVSVFVVFVVVYVFAFGHLSHMFRTASTQYIHLCNCFV